MWSPERFLWPCWFMAAFPLLFSPVWWCHEHILCNFLHFSLPSSVSYCIHWQVSLATPLCTYLQTLFSWPNPRAILKQHYLALRYTVVIDCHCSLLFLCRLLATLGLALIYNILCNGSAPKHEGQLKAMDAMNDECARNDTVSHTYFLWLVVSARRFSCNSSQRCQRCLIWFRTFYSCTTVSSLWQFLKI